MPFKNHPLYSLLMLCFLHTTVSAQVSFTSSSSLLGNGGGNGVNDCTVDMNGDHLDDVVRVNSNGLYIDFQQTDGTFSQNFYPVNFQNSPNWSICAGDLDGNGFNDLLFGGGSRVSFVMANSSGTAYTENFINDYIFSQRSTMADIDNDGDLDAFVCHDVDLSHPYRNDGFGNMTEDQSLIQTINAPGNYAAIWVDYDNDFDADLYITKCRQGAGPGNPARTNAMYQNNGDGTFTEVAADIGLADNAQSWATAFEDFDNDGDFDAFIVNHDFQNRFYRNNGDGTFTDIILSTGIDPNDLGAWSNAAADFNNDGYIDILSEMNNRLYINNGDLTFTGQSAPFTRGGICDLNDDGFLDVVRAGSAYLNDGNDNNWVKLSFEGVTSNKNGIGARVEIHGTWGVQTREIRSGQSFRPMSSLNAHFGIGTATAIDQIVVRWPSGFVSTLNNPSINTTHLIVEENCLLPPATLEVSTDPLICQGNSVTLFFPDGFETGEWSTGETTNSITVSEEGIYNAMLFDAGGCLSFSEDVVVEWIIETVPEIAVAGDPNICVGENVELTTEASSNPQWSNGQSGQSISVNETGEYFVQVDAICATEPLFSEVTTINVYTSPEPTVLSIAVDDQSVAQIMVEGESPVWYDAASGGQAIGTGATFNSPTLTTNTTYYVENVQAFPGEIQTGGKPNVSGQGGLTTLNSYNFFDVWEPFTLLTVEAFIPFGGAEGWRDIQLVNDQNVVLEEIVVFLIEGLNTITLNFEVPVGNNFSLRCPQNDLFRNNGGVNYPYPIGDVGTITNSFFGSLYYYYFYNWQIQKQGATCISERIPVEVGIVNIASLMASPAHCGQADGEIQLVLNGGIPPFEYSWNDNTLNGSENPTSVLAGNYQVTVTDTYGSSASAIVSVIDLPAQSIISFNVDAAHCDQSDGSISLQTQGGTMPYIYDWDHDTLDGQEDPQNIAAGTYNLIITDQNGCTTTGTYVVENEATQSITEASVATAHCDQNDGSISLQTQGGTIPYVYDWNDDTLDGQEDPQNIAAGTYIVTITDQFGCTVTGTYVVENEAGQSIMQFTAENAHCGQNDGAIILQVEGGTMPYVYDWNDDTLDGQENPQNITAGAYIVTITDQFGCAVESALVLEDVPGPTITGGEIEFANCGQNDGSMAVFVNGGTMPYLFDWTDDELDGMQNPANVGGGIYEVTVTDAFDCWASTTLEVEESENIMIEEAIVTPSIEGQNMGAIEITIQEGTAPYDFDWDNDIYDGQEDISQLSPGIYILTITDANGCTFSDSFEVDGIINHLSGDFLELHDLTLFPNPSTGLVQLRFNLEENLDLWVEIYDVLGQQIFQKLLMERKAGHNNITLDLRDKPTGVFLIKVRSGAKFVVKKLILER